jgi:hypothetical protein
MSAQHTPGPWHVGRRSAKTWHLGIYSQDGSEVAKVDVQSALQLRRRTANAIVMAASPKLLKALQELVSLEADGMQASESAIEAWERARAAIANATGVAE